MKLTIEKADLLTLVQTASRAVARSSAMPVLECVRLSATDGALEARGISSERSIETHCPCIVTTPGECAVNATRLMQTVKAMPDGLMDLEEDIPYLHIKSGKSRVSMMAIEGDRFPGFPAFEGQRHAVTIPALTLAEMLGRSVWAAADRGDRAAFSGVHWVFTTGRLVIEATDGHRANRISRDMDHGLKNRTEILLPKDAAETLQSMIADASPESIELSIGIAAVRVIIGDTSMIAALQEGRFPNMDAVMPKPGAGATTATLGRADLLASIRRLGLVLDGKKELRGGTLSFRPLLCEMRAESKTLGRSIEEIPCELTGKELDVHFNLDYLVEVVSQVEADGVRLEMTRDTSAVLVTDEKDGDWSHVIMPWKMT